jgi:hypothetical protein
MLGVYHFLLDGFENLQSLDRGDGDQEEVADHAYAEFWTRYGDRHFFDGDKSSVQPSHLCLASGRIVCLANSGVGDWYIAGRLKPDGDLAKMPKYRRYTFHRVQALRGAAQCMAVRGAHEIAIGEPNAGDKFIADAGYGDLLIEINATVPEAIRYRYQNIEYMPGGGFPSGTSQHGLEMLRRRLVAAFEAYRLSCEGVEPFCPYPYPPIYNYRAYDLRTDGTGAEDHGILVVRIHT